jgi:uncharacterized membrane protein
VTDFADDPRARLSALVLLVGTLAILLIPTFIARDTCVGGGGGMTGSADWCYTEVPRLMVTEGVDEGRLPYLERCPETAGTVCDEYPVLTMYPMWLAARVGHSPEIRFLAAGTILFASALLTAWLLWRIVGVRAFYFAAAPTLLLYGPMNWDLIAVAAMMAAVAFHLHRRDPEAGVATGLGIAAKVLPGVACAPMTFVRDRAGRASATVAFVTAAVVTWFLVNIPFALFGTHGWTEVFRFNASRPVDIDSLWSVGCRVLNGSTACGSVRVVDAASAILFVAGITLVWRTRIRHIPLSEPWTMGFAMLAVFYLTNKVYSPQYDLLLLPWFALVLPSLPAFLAFEAAGIAIFLTRFEGFATPSLDLFEVAIVLRAVVLISCLILYIRGTKVATEPRRAVQTEAGRARR